VFAFCSSAVFFFGFVRALAAGLPCQNNSYKTTYESFRFYSKFFDEMYCKLDSTENPRSLQKYPTPPSYLTVTFFLFWFWIHTASMPSTAGTSTGGDAVLWKPKGSTARRHSRNSCHMFVCIVVCACSQHSLDFKILLFGSFVTRKNYCVATSCRSKSILLREWIEFT